jgi:hypothetical protein
MWNFNIPFQLLSIPHLAMMLESSRSISSSGRDNRPIAAGE